MGLTGCELVAQCRTCSLRRPLPPKFLGSNPARYAHRRVLRHLFLHLLRWASGCVSCLGGDAAEDVEWLCSKARSLSQRNMPCDGVVLAARNGQNMRITERLSSARQPQPCWKRKGLGSDLSVISSTRQLESTHPSKALPSEPNVSRDCSAQALLQQWPNQIEQACCAIGGQTLHCAPQASAEVAHDQRAQPNKGKLDSSIRRAASLPAGIRSRLPSEATQLWSSVGFSRGIVAAVRSCLHHFGAMAQWAVATECNRASSAS